MRIQYYLTCMFLFLLGAANLQAQTQYIGPDNGDWFTAANWNNGLPAAGNDALVGGGVTVVVGSPLAVGYTITAFGNISTSAAITVAVGGTLANSGTLTVSATGSLTNNGTVQNFGTMSFAGAAGFTNETGASFTNGGSFTLQTTLVNRGAITNNGTIDATNGTLQTQGSFNNNQTLTTKSLTVNASSSFTNNFGATLNITGAAGNLLVDGSFTNNGTVNASGTMTVNGSFANNVFLNVLSASVLTVNASAQLTNAGTLDNLGFVQNYGTLTNGQTLTNRGEVNNFATFNNNNLIDNRTGATFFNRPAGTLGMGFGSKILNGGTFTNQNAINSFGTVENNGSFVNSGTLLSFGGSLVDNNAAFTNNNTLSTNDVVANDGTFTNNGSVNVNGGSVWSNFGTFVNSTGGTVTVVQDFNNKATGLVTNNGTFRNSVRTRNEGSFTNNAYLHNPGDFTNAAGATLTNNELFFLQAGNLLNAGSLVNTDKTLVDECSSVKNTGSINNTGGNFELHGILFQNGTLSGNAVNNKGGYIHTAPTSAAPSVCKNGSFGADINGEIKVYAGSLVSFENFDSCANIIYLANGVDRPVFHCSDIPTVQNLNLVVRTRLGDSLTCVAQVTPLDLLEPQFSACPKDQVIFTPNATATATWTAPTATDNCSTVTLTSTHAPGASFPVGITGVTYTATDIYNNQNQCQFRIDVRQTPPGSNCTGDTAGPTFAGCPSNISTPRLANLTPVAWTAPTPSDNCKPINLTSTHSPGQGFPVGVTTVTYTAKDGNNNSSTCTFTVTVTTVDPCVNDTQKPTISSCPANIYLPTNTAINGAVAIWNAPNVADNCGVTGLTASHVPGAVFPVGTTTVTYTATDAANNSATCNFTITVGADPCPGDATAPNISGCPANISLLTSGISATATWTAPTATDPCAPVTVNSNYASGSVFPLGVTQVTYQFSDKKGNVSTCNFTVTVQNSCAVDNVAPVITGCPANITVAATSGSGATATWTAPTATDNCGLSSFVSSYQPGANFPVGTTTVVYTAIDVKGNSSNCSFNVNVVTGPACTTNAAPINATTGVNAASVALSWNSAANATSYDVYLGTANPPTTTVATNVTGTSTTVTNLAANTTYFWYVVPKNAAGSATGCSSSATSFTTAGGATGGGNCNVTLGSIVREIWNINTWNLADIDGFGTPNSTANLTQFALTATENGSNYMDRVRGYLVPSATGNYTFNVTGDDYTELYLSTNANPASKQKIAWHNGYTGQTEYTKYATQTSATIALTAGQVYYIELKHLEAGGQDHFRASWKTPSSNTWTTIPGARLAPFTNIAQPSAVCKNISLQLNAVGQAVQITGQQVDGGSSAGCGASITSYNVSPTSFSQPGTYTATLTVTNSFGLSSTCTATVTVLAPPCTVNNVVCESNVNDAGWVTQNSCAVSVCVGNKVILSVNPNGLPSYQWSGPNGYTATGNSGGDALVSNSITAAQAGTYTVTLTDANGCTASKSIQVTVTNCNACDGNLLVNKGFESGTAGWTWMQNAGTTTSSPNAGTKSLQICTGSGGISQAMPALPGISYTMKINAKVSGATGSVGLRFFDKNWNVLAEPSVAVSATNYTQYTVTATAPFAAAYVETWVWKNTNGCLYADEACMTSSAGFPTCSNNLMGSVNPGFESNLTAWDWVEDVTISTTNKYAGSKGAQVCTWDGGAGNQLNATPGATYSMQVWAKVSGSVDWAGVGINFYDANWNQIGASASREVSTTDWTLHLVQAVAPINAKYVDFWFWKDYGGCLYVDEFCVTATGGGGSACDPDVLFVVGNTFLNAGDNWAKNRLQQLGLNVTVKSATSAVAADANGKGAVIISSTVNAVDVGSKFTNVTVPVVTWESYLLDDLKLTGTVAQTDYGQNTSFHSLTITDPSHPLSAGLTGNVQVYSSANYMRWGWTTQAAAAKAAKVTGQESWYGIFGFAQGAAMHGGFAAPARRASIFLDDNTATLLTTKGVQLFDAAIEWAIGCHLAGNLGTEGAVDRSSQPTQAIPTDGEVQVHPNPASDRLFLTFGQGGNLASTVRLFDINGKAVSEWKIEASTDPIELSLDGVPSGQYLLWIAQDGQQPVSKRIVVANRP